MWGGQFPAPGLNRVKHLAWHCYKYIQLKILIFDDCSKSSKPICQNAFSLIVPMTQSLDLTLKLINSNSVPGLNHCEISIQILCPRLKPLWNLNYTQLLTVLLKGLTYFFSFVYKTLEVCNVWSITRSTVLNKNTVQVSQFAHNSTIEIIWNLAKLLLMTLI